MTPSQSQAAHAPRNPGAASARGSYKPSKPSKTTLFKVSWRSIVAHKVRLMLTVLAVVLGTAFVAGSFMFTNSLGRSFDAALHAELADVDAVVQPKEQSLPRSLLDTLRNDPEVARVQPDESRQVVLATEDRKAISAGGMTIQLAPWSDTQVGKEDLTFDSGEAPKAADEVVIPHEQSEKLGLHTGDHVVIVDDQGQRTARISGEYTNSNADGLNLRVLMPEEPYLEAYHKDTLDTLLVEGRNLHGQELVDYLAGRYPDTQVESGAKLAEDLSSVLREGLKFVTYFLVAFGLIALLVGTFIIANTFTMVVTQRMKEFALLRALGASKKQLSWSVLAEALIVGVLGSVLGVFAGMGLVLLIQVALGRFGLSLPGATLGVNVPSVVVPIILGVIVTVVSAWIPAHKAGRVRPVEAMRATEASAEASLTVRTIIGSIVLGFGALAALAGVLLSSSSTGLRSGLVGLAALFVVPGLFMVSPALSRPVAGTIGRIVGKPFGAMGKLASTNARRQPRRTAATAFALTLGVALVTTIGMMASTMNEAVSKQVESSIAADFLLSPPQGTGITMPRESLDAVRSTEGVGSVVAWYSTPVSLGAPVSAEGSFASFSGGHVFSISGNLSDAVNLKGVEGSLNMDTPDVAAVGTPIAQANNWKVGDMIPLFGPNGSQIGEVKLQATFEPDAILPMITVSQSTLEKYHIDTQLGTMAVQAADGTSSEDLRPRLEQAVQDYVVVRVQSPEQISDESAQWIDQMMNVLYGLLALAVIVAVIGIINTLALNVIERRQEIGMLRAVGAQRSQIRRMITVESMQVALYGCVMGVVLGIGLATPFLIVLSEESLGGPTVPYGQILWMLLGSAVVGVLAAVLPARSAAKTPPLEAIVD